MSASSGPGSPVATVPDSPSAAGTLYSGGPGPAALVAAFAGQSIAVAGTLSNYGQFTWTVKPFLSVSAVGGSGSFATGTWRGWLVNATSNTFVGMYFDGGGQCAPGVQQRVAVRLACAATVSMVGGNVVESPQCYYAFTLGHPAVCGADLAVRTYMYAGSTGPAALVSRLAGSSVTLPSSNRGAWTMNAFQSVQNSGYGIGYWHGWLVNATSNSYTGMLYTDGDVCNLGGALIPRQSVVYLQCAYAPGIVGGTVVENPTCTYTYTLAHPAVCGVDLSVGGERATPSGTPTTSFTPTPTPTVTTNYIAQSDAGPWVLRNRLCPTLAVDNNFNGCLPVTGVAQDGNTYTALTYNTGAQSTQLAGGTTFALGTYAGWAELDGNYSYMAFVSGARSSTPTWLTRRSRHPPARAWPARRAVHTGSSARRPLHPTHARALTPAPTLGARLTRYRVLARRPPPHPYRIDHPRRGTPPSRAPARARRTCTLRARARRPACR